MPLSERTLQLHQELSLQIEQLEYSLGENIKVQTKKETSEEILNLCVKKLNSVGIKEHNKEQVEGLFDMITEACQIIKQNKVSLKVYERRGASYQNELDEIAKAVFGVEPSMIKKSSIVGQVMQLRAVLEIVNVRLERYNEEKNIAEYLSDLKNDINVFLSKKVENNNYEK